MVKNDPSRQQPSLGFYVLTPGGHQTSPPFETFQSLVWAPTISKVLYIDPNMGCDFQDGGFMNSHITCCDDQRQGVLFPAGHSRSLEREEQDAPCVANVLA